MAKHVSAFLVVLVEERLEYKEAFEVVETFAVLIVVMVVYSSHIHTLMKPYSILYFKYTILKLYQKKYQVG